MRSGARYDGLADWYDAEFQPAPLESETWEVLVRLLGNGSGSLIDVGCGTGAYAVGLAERGWEVTGTDMSADMLRRAQAKGVHAIPADATSLPFEDASFDAAVSVFTHSDVGDFPGVVREVARVIRPGAPFVYVGLHPCFVGPHSRFVEGRGVPQLHAGWYRESRRYDDAPGISPTGLRAKVGATHLPLAEFLQSFLDAGFALERIEEPGSRDYPIAIALRCR
ncbi:MAG TPA: methyltransferase domain-containing protein [Gaiellaceae bacterium]|nr:methyltransferase domain-containing protein [Gaiellaceae bacterium]